MAAQNPFQLLRTLSRSPLKFPHQIAGAPCEKQFRDCVPNLHDDEVVQLIDYLDNVRPLLASPDFGHNHNHPRFYAPWILQVLRSGSAYIGSGGYAVLVECYRNLAKSRTFPF